jgi:Uma2 family endonuclease
MKKLIETATMTVEEYIAFEEKSETRHEFINGQLYEMPGTTDSHNDLCFNITAIMKQLIRATPFRAYMESVKVRIKNDKDYTYPDIFVTDERDANSPLIKRYPSVIIEVLSDGTRVYDKTDKFIRYQKIDSLRHYLTVEPEKTLVECYTKQADGTWEVETFTDISETISLPSLNVTLAMRDIYE